MDTKPKRKIISVHRVIGRYEVEGKLTCIPAPRPGQERAFVDSLIDCQHRYKTPAVSPVL